MKKTLLTTLGIVLGLVILIGGPIALRLAGRVVDNRVNYAEHKIDEATRYELLKKVEDTCRAMIASYTTDCLTYEQYKDSDNEEKQGWAEQARMRANKTASTYNNYILENSYLWAGNVPDDIAEKLDYI